MKILIDGRLLTRGGQSGVEEYTRQMITNLLATDRRNQYLLFCNSFRHGHKRFSAALNSRRCKFINWRLPNNLLMLINKFTNLVAVDKLTATDLIYSPHIDIVKSAKAPRIMTIHDLSFIHYPYFFNKKYLLWHWLQNIKNQANQAAKIITVSQYTKADIIETLQISPDKIEVIYPGISDLKIKLPANKNSVKNLQPYILYLGTIEPRKNISTAIKAFELIKTKKEFANLKLVIAGKFGWLYKDIVSTYKKSHFRKNIIFLGEVTNEQKTFLYTNAEVFVYPSFFEGFGFPPLEAQSLGCPVIASRRSSLPEILGESAILLDPWRASDWADNLSQLLTNHSQRNLLISRGFANCQKFNWEKSARSLKLNLDRFAIVSK